MASQITSNQAPHFWVSLIGNYYWEISQIHSILDPILHYSVRISLMVFNVRYVLLTGVWVRLYRHGTAGGIGMSIKYPRPIIWPTLTKDALWNSLYFYDNMMNAEQNVFTQTRTHFSYFYPNTDPTSAKTALFSLLCVNVVVTWGARLFST